MNCKSEEQLEVAKKSVLLHLYMNREKSIRFPIYKDNENPCYLVIGDLVHGVSGGWDDSLVKMYIGLEENKNRFLMKRKSFSSIFISIPEQVVDELARRSLIEFEEDVEKRKILFFSTYYKRKYIKLTNEGMKIGKEIYENREKSW